MPDITPGSEYLVAFLHSAGTATSTGMGLTGLSWQELEAWVKCTDLEKIVTPRDLKIVHTLSRAYARESALATDKKAKPPYVPPTEIDDEILQATISDKVDDIFKSLMASPFGEENM